MTRLAVWICVVTSAINIGLYCLYWICCKIPLAYAIHHWTVDDVCYWMNNCQKFQIYSAHWRNTMQHIITAFSGFSIALWKMRLFICVLSIGAFLTQAGKSWRLVNICFWPLTSGRQQQRSGDNFNEHKMLCRDMWIFFSQVFDLFPTYILNVAATTYLLIYLLLSHRLIDAYYLLWLWLHSDICARTQAPPTLSSSPPLHTDADSLPIKWECMWIVHTQLIAMPVNSSSSSAFPVTSINIITESLSLSICILMMICRIVHLRWKM